MKLFKIIPIFLFLISSIHLIAQKSGERGTSNKGALFAGLINGGEVGKDSLLIRYEKDMVVDFAPNIEEFYVLPDEKGAFSFSLSKANGLGKIYLRLVGSNETPLCPSLNFMNYYVENSDSIFLHINILEDGKATHWFSGKGVDKYFAAESIFITRLVKDSFEKRYYEDAEEGKDHVDDLTKMNELRLSIMRSILEYYKERISSDVYKLYEADIVGLNYTNLLANITTYKRNGKYDILNETINRLKENSFLGENILASSSHYTNFILRKTVIKSQIKNHHSNYTCSDIYELLKIEPDGLFKDKLITKYLHDQQYRILEQSDQILIAKKKLERQPLTEYESIVADAFQSKIHDFRLKEVLRKSFSRYKIGANAYDFALQDMNNNIVHLSDFKGKVVFIDVYGPGCTGCVKFAKKLKETIIPEFRGNSDVVFVAISVDEKKEKWIKDLNESDRNASKELQVCLWAGLRSEQAFYQNYDLHAYPLLILIDKAGKMFSSSNDNMTISLPVENVIKLIRDALGGNN